MHQIPYSNTSRQVNSAVEKHGRFLGLVGIPALVSFLLAIALVNLLGLFGMDVSPFNVFFGSLGTLTLFAVVEHIRHIVKWFRVNSVKQQLPHEAIPDIALWEEEDIIRLRGIADMRYKGIKSDGSIFCKVIGIHPRKYSYWFNFPTKNLNGDPLEFECDPYVDCPPNLFSELDYVNKNLKDRKRDVYIESSREEIKSSDYKEFYDTFKKELDSIEQDPLIKNETKQDKFYNSFKKSLQNT